MDAARMNPDPWAGDQPLKKTRSGNLFMKLAGPPE
jgi:hypothetical protein